MTDLLHRNTPGDKTKQHKRGRAFVRGTAAEREKCFPALAVWCLCQRRHVAYAPRIIPTHSSFASCFTLASLARQINAAQQRHMNDCLASSKAAAINLYVTPCGPSVKLRTKPRHADDLLLDGALMVASVAFG